MKTFEQVPGVGRDVSVVVPGIKINGDAPRVDAPPPELGSATEDILTELGYSVGEIENLKDSGAV